MNVNNNSERVVETEYFVGRDRFYLQGHADGRRIRLPGMNFFEQTVFNVNRRRVLRLY